LSWFISLNIYKAAESPGTMALVTNNSRFRTLVMSKTTQICVEEDVVSSNVLENTEKPALPQSSWKSCVWDTFDKSPEERRFLFKLDVALLTFATLGMWHGLLYWLHWFVNIPFFARILRENARSEQHQQRIRVWDVRTRNTVDTRRTS
jgi:hypothetical protein